MTDGIDLDGKKGVVQENDIIRIIDMPEDSMIKDKIS